eukprot:TRINITY_DN6494_c0_g1_i2.p1 TRINITY_DN6494_c0_g1~~TRINITY_DN6494_c0_g1_i2.p1  ORF type:complete len:527 (-),score=158.16 TRINITY_DN6494_c0_g1_i2:578-2158(-)
MILMDAKEMAAKMAQESIADCVVAVSPEFDTFQKMALKNSLEIAGLKPLAFVSENMAASIRYAIDGLVAKDPSTVMYINMGAGSFKVSLMKHFKENSTETQKVVDKIEVMGEAWDKTLGGRQFDYEVAELLADKFNALPQRKGKKDIRENKKAMRKLLAAAEGYKEKLTAAKFLKVYVDNLEDYVDLVVEITREEFEKRVSKFEPRVARVINEAIKDANVQLPDVDAIELVGSGLRVPLVMDMIVRALNGTKPSQRLNQEEAISFGSGFLAARLSHSFKVKTILPTLSSNYEISMELKSLHDTPCTDSLKLECSKKPFHFRSALMKRKEKYDTGKLVKIPFNSDFSATLYESITDIGEAPVVRKLMSFKIKGVNEVAAKLDTPFKVHLKFEADDLGIIGLMYAKAVAERTVNESDGKVRRVDDEYSLEVVKESAYPLPMTPEQIKKAKQRIQEIVDKEKKELERSKEKNAFESAIYNVRDWLNDEKNEKFIDATMKEKLIGFLAEVRTYANRRRRNGFTLLERNPK